MCVNSCPFSVLHPFSKRYSEEAGGCGPFPPVILLFLVFVGEMSEEEEAGDALVLSQTVVVATTSLTSSVACDDMHVKAKWHDDGREYDNIISEMFLSRVFTFDGQIDYLQKRR